ncbi:HAUS augmin-like complex subunit 4 [Madurella fahalii]|uniref:HAUS augmin-like complex subunit 4 n=1 Tax=Madurella fahalii TaxID=1157608 RepID=A0ABQ0G494_9PEZI
MLPAIDEAVLQNNPQFAALYSTLKASILDSDGSTKRDAAAKERSAVREELNEYRLKDAKQSLLIHAISTSSPRFPQSKHVQAPSLNRRARPHQQTPIPAAELPAPLLDLLFLLSPLLKEPSSLPQDSESVALLLSSPPFSDLPTLLPQLATLISGTLHSSAVHLARIANPSTNPSYVHRSIPNLPAYRASLAKTVADRKVALTGARLAAATALTSLLQQQTAVLSQLLRVLEAKHGPIARSLEFRASEAALMARRQQAEAETALWQARRDTYTPEAAQALANYAAHMQDARARLTEAVHRLRSELDAYGVGLPRDGQGRTGDSSKGAKEKVMREMARVYRDMGRQVEEVRGDLERLGGA